MRLVAAVWENGNGNGRKERRESDEKEETKKLVNRKLTQRESNGT